VRVSRYRAISALGAGTSGSTPGTAPRRKLRIESANNCSAVRVFAARAPASIGSAAASTLANTCPARAGLLAASASEAPSVSVSSPSMTPIRASGGTPTAARIWTPSS
jgi:hypothetical protein